MRRMMVVGGPTASGKSRAGVLWARRIGGEVVNADPFQVWRGMEVLTAQPTEEERMGVPHHLFGAYGPDYERTAHDFAAEVARCCEEVRGRGRMPVVVSGSGLYLRALAGGVDEGIPAPDAELRLRLESRELEDLVAELNQLDPVEAARIDRMNKRRVVRALEICLLAGRPVSELRVGLGAGAGVGGPIGVWLDVEPVLLRRRIEARAREMFEAGVVEEVAALERWCGGAEHGGWASSPEPEVSDSSERSGAAATLGSGANEAGGSGFGMRIGASAGRTLGLDLVRRVVRGEIGREEAVEKLAVATWQLAKRQRTWFRKAAELVPVPVGEGDSAEDVVARMIERFPVG